MTPIEEVKAAERKSKIEYKSNSHLFDELFFNRNIKCEGVIMTYRYFFEYCKN